MSNFSAANSSIRASVIVPAYNAEKTLGECLAALEKQSVPRDRYEVIVVDDGSRDNTAAVARSFGVRVLQQSNQGPAAARNVGAKIAQGEILLFTDSDCIPTYHWLERMLSPFADPSIVAAKGSYQTMQREWVARLVQAEYEEKYQRMARERYIDFVDTYSAAYRRDAFIAAGGFDTAFPVPSAEDQEFSFRLASLGHKMVFVPEAVVLHRHPSLWFRYLERKYRFGYWRVLVHWKHPKKALRDSHTLQVQKVQMALAGLVLLGAITSAVARDGVLVAGFSTGAFLVSSLAFIKRAADKGPLLGVLAVPFLFLRAYGLLVGVAAGALTLPFRMNARRIKTQRHESQAQADPSAPFPGPHPRH